MTAIRQFRALLRVAAVAALAIIATPLLARSPQSSGAPTMDRDPPEGFQPGLSAAAGEVCVKQCPNDQLPCDPPAFKIADGRCTTQWK